jgi:hypothetical protein
VATRNLIKSLGILTLGTLILYGLLSLIGVESGRMASGLFLFVLLGGLDLVKESRS